jgi:hypothetical protein
VVLRSAACAPISSKRVSGPRGQSADGLPDYFRIADDSPRTFSFASDNLSEDLGPRRDLALTFYSKYIFAETG